MENTQKEASWSIQESWNRSLTVAKKDRRIQPRDFLYASEVGRPYLDVYWSMQGIEPTNVQSDTARRKMEAGNFYEAVVGWVFQRVGILKETQAKARLIDNPDYLNVYGRIDIIAGHDGNWDKTKKEMDEYFNKLIELEFDFPFFGVVKKISTETINYLSEKYPAGLEDKLYEVKSINSMAFWKNDEPIGTPYPHHINQFTFYQYYHQIKNGSFLYLDRDTMSISELPNIIKDEVVKDIHDWLKKMTYYYRNNIEPPKPQLIIWDIKEQKYQFNWEVNWSAYKDKILEGVNVDKINEEIKEKNKMLRRDKMIKNAVNGDNVRGTKKFNTAIQMLKDGKENEEILKKSGCTQEEVDILKEKI